MESHQFMGTVLWGNTFSRKLWIERGILTYLHIRSLSRCRIVIYGVSCENGLISGQVTIYGEPMKWRAVAFVARPEIQSALYHTFWDVKLDDHVRSTWRLFQRTCTPFLVYARLSISENQRVSSFQPSQELGNTFQVPFSSVFAFLLSLFPPW